jgi:hypothetical protein
VNYPSIPYWSDRGSYHVGLRYRCIRMSSIEHSIRAEEWAIHVHIICLGSIKKIQWLYRTFEQEGEDVHTRGQSRVEGTPTQIRGGRNPLNGLNQ